ncbi:MAG: outer membrane component of tripartite multidrug resistance system [Halothiobacillus sp. 28-55-5]|nr:MAG: outer membrane component of tripartite multidrug resistance system [Halothiobacillus sp. 28-55-5]
MLATLTGQMPGAAHIPTFNLDALTLPSELPVVVPSAWVRARPDIQAASALLHVATAQYGVAVANLYPQINLSATLGSQGITPASLFNASSLIWSLIGGLTQPIFNGGLKAASEAASANVSASAANYQQVVLDGLRNVADTLQACYWDADTLSAQVAAEQSAKQSLSLVEQQLKLGSATSLQLLTAQQQVTQSRLLTLAARAQRLSDSVALYQAMGSEQTPPTPNLPSSTHLSIHSQPESNTK